MLCDTPHANYILGYIVADHCGNVRHIGALPTDVLYIYLYKNALIDHFGTLKHIVSFRYIHRHYYVLKKVFLLI
jgi:hypothetical protein